METIAITQSKETQSQLSPASALQMLKEGNQRFISGDFIQRDLHAQVKATAGGQYPHSVIISCIDSRKPTEILFDQGIGDVFNARVAGNFVNTDILGSVEYGCKVAGSKLVLVLGHTSCGAVKGACDHVELGNITPMLENIMPAVDGTTTEPGEARDSGNSSFVNRVAAQNVTNTMDRIRKESPVLNEMEQNGEIKIVGAIYDVATGKVDFWA